MSNLTILDSSAAEKYVKATGAGSNADPFVVEHYVTGTVTVQDGNGSLTVDGPVTDTQLRATPVPISDGGGSLTVDGPVTDTQLRAAPVPISDGNSTLSVDDGAGSLTVDIAAATWTDFYAAYGSGDGTGDKTVLAAPSAGNALQFIEMVVVCGEAAANTVLIKKGATTVKAVPMAAVLDGIYLKYEYPDFHTFPAATAFVVNNLAAKIFYVYGRYRTVAV